MSVSQAQLNRAISQAHAREAQGYFERARQGDQKAASLFVRMVAYDLNPNGLSTDYGWLSKRPGESQVDGYAEDAICGNADPNDLQNAVDMVNGAGAPGASIGGAVRERRPTNNWVAPQPLTADEVVYLLYSGEPHPIPPPTPTYPPYPGDAVFDAVGVVLFADYAEAGQAPNPQMGRWFGRTIYDWLAQVVPTLDASIKKHRAEWRAVLGLPPL